ncbi:hypothetical protein QP948_09365 [Corynebacterium bovis]|uniref:hypothetical protein n=1 Tax=Corynebacterium bovis TaxID=36808 RepID=UPI002550488A|nr:hypothetical protein [Corynebacterium bovis]MDK8511592.1 hypothetical protein [Corynebacterium bovis]
MTATLLGIAITSFVAWFQLRRDKKKMIAETLTDVTTGEVAAARNIIGKVIYGDLANNPEDLNKAGVLHSHYVLTWAIERMAAQYKNNRFFNCGGNQFSETLDWNVVEIVQNVHIIQRALAPTLKDESSKERLDKVSKEITAHIEGFSFHLEHCLKDKECKARKNLAAIDRPGLKLP